MKSVRNCLKAFIVIVMFLFAISSSAYTETVQSGSLTYTLSDHAVFRVSGATNLNGNIRIESTQSAHIEISFESNAKASSPSEEKRFLDLIDYKLIPSGRDMIEFIIWSPTHAPWEGSNHHLFLDIRIKVPEKMEIEVRGKFLDYDISGPFEGVDFKSEFSAVTIERIYGTVEIETTAKEVVLRTIKGEIYAKTTHGDITAGDLIVKSGNAIFQSESGAIYLKDVRGSVEAYTAHAVINVENIDASEGSIVLRTDYSPIYVKQTQGEIICETNHAPITITDAIIDHGQSEIETSFAPVEAEFDNISDCDIYITSNYDDVSLKLPHDVSARLLASVGGGGQIRARNLNVYPTLLNPTRFEGILDDGDSRIEVKVSGVGNVLFDGYK